MNNRSNSGPCWHDSEVSEFSALMKMPAAAGIGAFVRDLLQVGGRQL